MKRRVPANGLAALVFVALVTNSEAAETGFHLLDFGVTERLTYQSTHSGANYSTMPSWNPGYLLDNGLDLRGYLGATGMKSNLGNFVAIQPQVGAAYRPDCLRLYPELLVGAETWAKSQAGTYAIASLNLHYALRVPASAPFFLRVLDTVTVGYSAVMVPSKLASQVTFGLRFGLWPTTTIESEERASESAPASRVALVPVSEAPKAPEPQTLDGIIGKLGRIDFKPYSADLLPSSNAELDKVVGILREREDLKVEVQGYTDSSGRADQNVRISQKRAESVKSYLVQHGIGEARLRARGFGPENPIQDNSTAEGRAANRRVEFHIIR